MSDTHTLEMQSRAIDADKLEKLAHREPSVRVLLIERDTLLARVDELEAQLAQPAVISADAGKEAKPAKKGK